MKKGTSAIAGILYFFMAIIIVAVLMPTLKSSISGTLNATQPIDNSTCLGGGGCVGVNQSQCVALGAPCSWNADEYETNPHNGFIRMVIKFWPVFFIIMILIIFMIIMRPR